jgi:hypothetical protein
MQGGWSGGEVCPVMEVTSELKRYGFESHPGVRFYVFYVFCKAVGSLRVHECCMA